ncbi:protein dispatched homolog 1-like [Antedon mediterranea]|uniref:protein dispatched homolog 1-like n=1 Tax=Antedon mediterranea TaxID=105859 RepID=UPI003AF92CF5
MEMSDQVKETDEMKSQPDAESHSPNVIVATKPSRMSKVMDKYSDWLSRFYWLVLLLIFLLVVILCVLSVVLRDLPGFEDPIKGFEPRGTVIKDRTLSYVNLKRDPLVRESWSNVEYNTVDSFDSNASYPRSRRDNFYYYKCSIEYADCPGIVFTHINDREDLLTPSNLKELCSVEITGSSGIYKVKSIGNYLAQFANKSCSSLDEGDIENGLNELQFCAPYYYKTTTDVEGKDRSCLYPNSYCDNIPETCKSDNIVFIIIHMMVGKEFMPDGDLDKKKLYNSMAFIELNFYDDEEELINIYKDYFDKSSRAFSNIQAVGLNFHIKYDVFSEYLFFDTIYLGIAAIFVIILICFYTRSPLIALAAFFNMIFSLTLAYFFYTIVFNLNFFPFLNVSTALLLVAIGADDTFIFCDLWDDASKMLSGSPLNIILRETMRHATVTMLVTSLTTAAAFYASAFSPIIAIRCFGVYAGTSIIANFLLTISWLPAAVILNAKFGCNFCSLSKFCPDLLDNIATSLLPKAVIKPRFIWTALFTGLAVAGGIVIFVAPGLQKPTSSEFQVFKSDDILEQYDLVYKNLFRFEEQGYSLPGAVLFGLQAVDNGKKWDPDDTGTVSYQSGFNIWAEDSQKWLQQFCQRLEDFNLDDSLDITNGCFIDFVIAYMEQPCESSDDNALCCNQTFPFSPENLKSCLPNILPEPYGLHLNQDDEVVVLEIRFSTKSYFSMEYTVMDTFWKEMEQWMQQNLVNVPKNLGEPWFIPPFYVGQTDYYDYLNFYDLQDSLARSTPIAIVTSIAVASLVLIFTQRNVLIALYSICSLSGTIFATIGSLILLGWELNILESVTFSITVGLSVDFTIHYGVAYLLCRNSDRESRMRYSIKTMALAIAFAAFSTFSVGAFMMAATVLVYRQLGTFLMIVMAISWLFSTLFFQSLCYLIGPQGSKFKLQCSK